MKKSFLPIIAVTGGVIGVLLTWQLASDPLIGSDFPTDEIQARSDLIRDFLDEQGYLQSRIVSLRKEIAEAQDQIDTKALEVNLKLLESLKEDLGLTEITGAGVEVVLDDSRFALREGVEVTDEELVQASDLRDVINLLRAAKADAISVNNQRILATSTVTSVGTTILVNNAHIAPPFTVKAVGDAELFLQRLLNESLLPSLYDRRQKASLVFEVVISDSLVIPVYNGDLKTTYLNLVE